MTRVPGPVASALPADPAAGVVGVEVAGDDADVLGVAARRHRDAGVGGDGDRAAHSRHDLERDAGGHQRLGLLRPAAEHEGVAALEPDDAPSLLRVPHQLGVDVVLARSGAGPAGLADVDHLRLGPHVLEHLLAHQPVGEHDVGLAEQLRGPQGQQPRVTRAGSHERHRPRPHGRTSTQRVGRADLDALAAGGAPVGAHLQRQARHDRVLRAGEQAGAARGAGVGDEVRHSIHRYPRGVTMRPATSRGLRRAHHHAREHRHLLDVELARAS
jgi:hypothetical protein